MIPHTETDISQAHIVKTVEAMLRGLLEKAQQASEIIAALRSDNQMLNRRNEEYQQRIVQLQRELSIREMELQEKVTDANQSADLLFEPEEIKMIREKLKDILAKLSQYV